MSRPRSGRRAEGAGSSAADLADIAEKAEKAERAATGVHALSTELASAAEHQKALAALREQFHLLSGDMTAALSTSGDRAKRAGEIALEAMGTGVAAAEGLSSGAFAAA